MLKGKAVLSASNIAEEWDAAENARRQEWYTLFSDRGVTLVALKVYFGHDQDLYWPKPAPSRLRHLIESEQLIGGAFDEVRLDDCNCSPG